MKTILYLFKPEFENHEGVRPIQIYLLRLVFALTFLFVGTNIWIAIFNHQGEWKPMDAVAFSVWAAYPTLSLLGIIRPLKLLPIIAFEIFYKITWLVLVAWPLWDAGTLEGSPVERMTKDFLWVVLPIVAMPWGYFFKGFFRRTTSAHAEHSS